MKIAIALVFFMGVLPLSSGQEKPPARDGVAPSIGLEIGQLAPAAHKLPVKIGALMRDLFVAHIVKEEAKHRMSLRDSHRMVVRWSSFKAEIR